MKKFFTIAIAALFAVTLVAPAFAGIADGVEVQENLNRGAQEETWAWTEVMQHTGEEASKADNTATDHVVGAFAGGVIGVRKGIHRIGAGAIDLLTFWIPKKESLIDPNDPVLR